MLKTLTLVLSLILVTSACTTASIRTPDGASVDFTRVWSDVTFTMAPDGSMSYSSNADPDTSLIQGVLSGRLQVVQ